MKCKNAEIWIFRSLDGLLSPEKKKILEKHINECPFCQKREKDYKKILDVLKKDVTLEPIPNFWKRLQSKIHEKEKYAPWSIWQKWSIRAIPVSLVLIIALVVAMAILVPRKQEEVSQSEILLLNDENPIQETQTLFEEERSENRNMMLIFTAMEEENTSGRYFP